MNRVSGHCIRKVTLCTTIDNFIYQPTSKSNICDKLIATPFLHHTKVTRKLVLIFFPHAHGVKTPSISRVPAWFSEGLWWTIINFSTDAAAGMMMFLSMLMMKWNNLRSSWQRSICLRCINYVTSNPCAIHKPHHLHF